MTRRNLSSCLLPLPLRRSSRNRCRRPQPRSKRRNRFRSPPMCRNRRPSSKRPQSRSQLRLRRSPWSPPRRKRRLRRWKFLLQPPSRSPSPNRRRHGRRHPRPRRHARSYRRPPVGSCLPRCVSGWRIREPGRPHRPHRGDRYWCALRRLPRRPLQRAISAVRLRDVHRLREPPGRSRVLRKGLPAGCRRGSPWGDRVRCRPSPFGHRCPRGRDSLATGLLRRGIRGRVAERGATRGRARPPRRCQWHRRRSLVRSPLRKG